MADISIFDIFNSIIQIPALVFDLVMYLLGTFLLALLDLLDLIYAPIALFWNTMIDLIGFILEVIDVSFGWASAYPVIWCFGICLGVFGIRIIIGIYYQIKKLIPVLG